MILSRKHGLATVGIALMLAGILGNSTIKSAIAAPIGPVLKACDSNPDCSYTINKSGDISGCSKTSGQCFYCPNDGKRECFGLKARTAQAGNSPSMPRPEARAKVQ